MSRFSLANESASLRRVAPPKVFRLTRPHIAFGPVGLIAVWGFVTLSLALLGPASLMNPMASAALGVGVCALLLAPLMDEGVNHAGATLRGGLAFFTGGLFAGLFVVVEDWRTSALPTPARLASLFMDAGPNLAMSAAAHGIAGALAVAVLVMAVAQKE